jgi:putative transposase
MIKKNLKQYSIRMMCRILQVSHSGYYHWRVKSLSKRDKRNQIICEKIESIFLKEKRRAGYRRVARKLKNEGIVVSYNHVAKLMKGKRTTRKGCT